MTELQSNQPMRSCQSLVAPSINTPRQRVKVSYGVSEPLVIAMFYTRDGELQWVDLPTFTDVIFMSPETEVCPSLYRNLERRDQVFNDHVKAYIATKKLDVALRQNDLAMNGAV